MNKIIGLSLVAAGMISAVNASDIKTDFSGDVKAFYQTSSMGEGQVFDMESSAASIGISFNANIAVDDTTNAGVKAIYLDNGGVKGTLTSGNFQNSSDTIALTEAFIAKRFGDTGVIIGRQSMSTPMLFSDSKNKMYETTVNAFTVMNKSIDGYTFVGALVGGSNDRADMAKFDDQNMGGSTYVAGIMSEPIEDVKANVWYYNVKDMDKDLFWADAKINTFMGADVMIQAALGTGMADAQTTMYGVMGEYEVEGIRVKGAYDHVEIEAGSMSVRNLADPENSSLYTEMFNNTNWIAGQNGMAAGMDSIMISAEKEMGHVNYRVAYGTDMEDNSEFNFVADTEYSGIGIETIVSVDNDSQNTDTTLAIYATYNF